MLKYVIFVTIIYGNCVGQSLTGTPGLVRIPTADFMNDGTFYIGANFLPKEVMEYSKYQRNILAVQSSLTFLPFLEVSLRLSKQLGLPASSNHTVDRMPSIRLRLLKEKKYSPSLAIGAHDIATTLSSGTARKFAATYAVISKRVESKFISYAFTIGQGFEVGNALYHEFDVTFGGMEMQAKALAPFSFQIDYDTKNVNFGINYIFFNMLHCKLAMLGFEYFGFGAHIHFNLLKLF